MIDVEIAPPLADHYAYCETELKSADRTAWLATLFAPADHRPGLHALGAFALDVSSVRGKVREPLAGELRLQWWTDAIEGETRGDVRGHPIAAALLDTIRRHHLSRPALTGFLDVKRADLYDEPIPDLSRFDERADRTEGALCAARAQILSAARDPVGAQAARHAGRALAALDSLQELGRKAARPHVTIPLDLLQAQGLALGDVQALRSSRELTAALDVLCRHAAEDLAALRRLRAALDPASGPAFLTTSLVGPALRRASGRSFDPFRDRLDLPQWRKQWLLWRASRRNGIL